MSEIDYYLWKGVPVEVEFFNGGWDVSGFASPRHPTGEVPAGETHVCVRFASNPNTGFWVEEEVFHEHAEPLLPDGDRL